MGTDYSELVEAETVAGAADLPPGAVRFVSWLDQPKTGRRALTGPDPASDGSCLSLAEAITFDGFGNLIAVRGAEGDEAEDRADLPAYYHYTAAELDTDPGWVYHRIRWYDPTPGRWVAEDPLGYAAGDLNLSRYVSSRAGLLLDDEGRAQ